MVNIEREITFHQKIDHPNIIRFYDYQKNDEQKKVLIALEFAENGDLFNFLNKKGALEEKLACKFFVQTALALNYIHQFKMIHRDVKPENILLDKQLNAKLCDFGWSAEYDENTKRQTICGTYEYMAPEIIFKKQQDTSIDIWSLGILLYELLHNKAPYSGRSMIEVSKKIASKRIDFDSQIAADAKDLILHILKTNPKERPSIKEILQAPFVRRTYGEIDDAAFTPKDKNQSSQHQVTRNAENQPNHPSTSSQFSQNNVKINLNSPSEGNNSNTVQTSKPKTMEKNTPATVTSPVLSISNKRPPLGPTIPNLYKPSQIASTQDRQITRQPQTPTTPMGSQKNQVSYNSQSRPNESNQYQLQPAHFTFERPHEYTRLESYPNSGSQTPGSHDAVLRQVQSPHLSSGQPGSSSQYPLQAKVILNLAGHSNLTENQIQKENGGHLISHYVQGQMPIEKKALQPVDYNAQPARQGQVIEDASKSNANLKLNTLRLKKVISDQPFMKPPVNTKEAGLKSFIGLPSTTQNQTVERVNSSFGGPSDSYRSIRKQNSLDVNKVVVQQVAAPINFYRPLGGHNTPITR
jgi:serine/threonine protein kinase